MAWWDHEELKALEDRSDLYKENFPEEYGKSGHKWNRKKKIWERILTKKEKIVQDHNNGKIIDPREYAQKVDGSWEKKPWTKATEENWAGDVRGLYEGQGFIYDSSKSDKEMFDMANELYTDSATIYPKKEMEYQKSQQSDNKYPRDIPKNSKFNEAKLLAELQDYIAGTYGEHYSQGDIQIFESIAANGHGEGFASGNIQKLAARYGKKHGHNRSDILKILHYGILLLWDHDKKGR
jgi:hypothetical protein